MTLLERFNAFLGRQKRKSDAIDKEIIGAYGRVFGSDDGQQVLRDLWSKTMDQATGPDYSDDMLRHLEGQRFIVKYIANKLEKGQQP